MSTANLPPVIDLAQEKAELLKLRDLDRAAHFATDVNAALSFFGEDYIYVRDGQIQHRSRADMEQTFTEYFRDAVFHEWDDLEPPIIQISHDATLASMIRRFRVRYSHPAAGQTVESTYIYAGVTTYEKRNGKWVRTANVSTFG